MVKMVFKSTEVKNASILKYFDINGLSLVIQVCVVHYIYVYHQPDMM